jgi:hypothetical protein
MPIGKCPDCGRTARLGKLVGELCVLGTDGFQLQETIPTDDRLTCTDCCFGPAMRFWKTCQECGAQTPNLSSCEVCRATESVASEGEPSRTRRRTSGFLAGIDLGLQAWCSRGRVLDTHAWCAKMERLNSLKVTSRQTLRTAADVRSLSNRV